MSKWGVVDKITQDLGFQRVSDESAKFQILPIFLTESLATMATKFGIFKIFPNRSNMGHICSALMSEVTL